ncbi:orotidine-5'-phosphate decarboxylase [Lentibacillus sp. N15]|uniref:orotidine-5'-phosphate decarboxylase n=1 Tax=Lentibacillus songyuanensis TaxID=3136161 RepID=UPI0031BA1F05
MNKGVYMALDFPTWDEAKSFIDGHELNGVPVKLGMELFYREGPRVIEQLKQDNHEIFLDLKLHDIPTTVMKTMKNLAQLEVDMVNVHALGGSEMIKQAKEGLQAGSSANHETALIAVTILTSMDQAVLNHELHMPGNVQENAVHFAEFAYQNGADGVVCSVHEARQVKDACGPSFVTVTPGIRLQESNVNDQKRVASPAFAKENGADILVVGRTVSQAENPKAAYRKVLEEFGYGTNE